MTAAQVMIPSVFSVAAAFSWVRLFAGSPVEGSTSGHRAQNSAAEARPIVAAVAANAQPLRSV